MKLLIYPAVSDHRFLKMRQAAAPMTVVQAQDESQAWAEIADADALFGSLTPAMLKAAAKLRWAQAPTASMEKYLFPELVEAPVVVTNMRGIFSDVIADHVFGFVLCFAKNLHTYFRQQMARLENCPDIAGRGKSIRPIERLLPWAIVPWASSAWEASAPKLRAAVWPSACVLLALIPWPKALQQE